MNQTAIEKINSSSSVAKWSWACRVLDNANYEVDASPNQTPESGDLVLVKVEKIGYHKTIVTSDNKKMRIYEGDLIVGVFGNRYATDALEGKVCGLSDISLLTAGGMIGTVQSTHEEFGRPTNVSFIGILKSDSQKVNLIKLKFQAAIPNGPIRNLIVVVGTGMNAGKTTSTRKIIKGLSNKGLQVAACKLTGSVSNRDQDEMRSASPTVVVDFSDYGFPSTYLSTREELINLFNTLLSDIAKTNPDVIIMEVADGVLQRETALLLSDPEIKKKISGVILAAESALSGLYAVERLKSLDYNVIAVTGKITSSPLYVREFEEHCKIPICSSCDSGKSLADTVIAKLGGSLSSKLNPSKTDIDSLIAI